MYEQMAAAMAAEQAAEDFANRAEAFAEGRGDAYITAYRQMGLRAADAYQDAKAGSGIGVAEALAAIAAYFYNPNGNVGPRKDESEANALAFQQRGALGNICQNAKWMLDNAVQHKLSVEADLDKLEAICDGSEISLNKLSFQIDRMEDCCNVQIPACEEWLVATTAAYEAIVGEKWVPFAKKGKSARDQTAEAVRARLAQLRGR